jgi:hypothetical protein
MPTSFFPFSQFSIMPVHRRDNRSRHWCFTVNNWTVDHDESLTALGNNESVTYLVYGYETGESGTPHLQGYICFKERRRFTSTQAALPRGAHIEIKRGTPLQASEYCKKEGVFQEFGTLPRASSGGNVFDDFKQWVLSEYSEHGAPPTEREIATEFSALYVRYGKRLRDLVAHLCPRPIICSDPLRDWQIPLYEALQQPCTTDRGILFYVDPDGGKGKSYFQRWMSSYYPDRVQVLGVGKRDDLAHTIEEEKDIFLFNVPRLQGEFLNYSILEMLKDRVVFSPKYDSHTKILQKIPHVVVFTNEFPDMGKMTQDRYIIEELS